MSREIRRRVLASIKQEESIKNKKEIKDRRKNKSQKLFSSKHHFRLYLLMMIFLEILIQANNHK